MGRVMVILMGRLRGDGESRMDGNRQSDLRIWPRGDIHLVGNGDSSWLIESGSTELGYYIIA